MTDHARFPLPTAGRPVTTVLQINNAIRREEPVYAELWLLPTSDTGGEVEEGGWNSSINI